MFSGSDLGVFRKYQNAGSHAFSNGVVTEEDKDIYQRIFETLNESASDAINEGGYKELFDAWNVRFGRDGGVQGHRPVDLWASVINQPPNAYGRFPQVYAIASAEGIELGFSVAIHESDYYNVSVKQRNREIIPLLYNKLPTSDSEVISDLNDKLSGQSEWLYGIKSRQGAKGNYASLPDLIEFLKSSKSSVQGGGSIFRFITPASIESDRLDLRKEFKDALDVFSPLMRALTPDSFEQVRIADINYVHDEAASIPEYDPSDAMDGRKKTLRSVAIRQGQNKFREKLIDAYQGRCAVTGVNVLATLQAAHIVPYNGPKTNTVQNGILLRADIHNLFDLGLLQIDPKSMLLIVSDELSSTPFENLHGQKLKLPKSKSQWPNKHSLEERFKLFNPDGGP